MRYVGFTGHKDPDIHLRMLSFGFPFDACQLPLNGFDAASAASSTQVLPELARQRIAAIGMKSLGGDGRVIEEARRHASTDALRYAMSLPVCTTVSGIDSLQRAAAEPEDRARLLADDRARAARLRAQPAPSRRPTGDSSCTRRRAEHEATSAASSTGSRRRKRWPGEG